VGKYEYENIIANGVVVIEHNSLRPVFAPVLAVASAAVG